MTSQAKSVLIRADASDELGSGHIIRCIALASKIKSMGHCVTFASRDNSGMAQAILDQHGFDCHIIGKPQSALRHHGEFHFFDENVERITQAQDFQDLLPALEACKPDTLIIDHYLIGESWIRQASDHVATVSILDDLSNRPLAGDIVINFACQSGEDYRGLLDDGTLLLRGYKFFIMREEFLRAPVWRKFNENNKINVTIFIGSVDQQNIIPKLISEIMEHPTSAAVQVDIILSYFSPNFSTVLSVADEYENVSVFENNIDIVDKYLSSDFVIGAGGGSAIERVELAVPSLCMSLASNQGQITSWLEREGLALTCRFEKDIDWPEFRRKLTEIFIPEKRQALSEKCQTVQVGLGAYLLPRHLTSETLRFRPALLDDAEAIYHWRYFGNRAFFYKNPMEPTFEQHKQWLSEKIDARDVYFLIANYGGQDIGYVRLDGSPSEVLCPEVSICISPEFSGKGKAKDVLEAFVSEFVLDLFDQCDAYVHKQNEPSIRLFKRCGFSERMIVKEGSHEATAGDDFICLRRCA